MIPNKQGQKKKNALGLLLDLNSMFRDTKRRSSNHQSILTNADYDKKNTDFFQSKQSVETPVEQARHKLSVAKNPSKAKRVKL